jgi:predicted  nucleic acid-binding Zn-ribbon protein
MDLDALGLNSTFVSTELDNSHHPPVDRIETDDIEGPEDFTMNMTYWMTADLPLSQIRSRKEAKTRRSDIRMDAMQERSEREDATEVGDQAVVEGEMEQRRQQASRTASPVRRTNGTTDEREYSTPASQRSMENEEKVRSFLSNLPDTDMEGALSGTPLHVPRHSFLQVPSPSPLKARSLQPTVEDYDTPRKPTQQTVIHHTSAIIDTDKQDVTRNRIVELQSRLEQQEMASSSRITELETILSYTRSELETARTNNYRNNERLSSLEDSIEQQKADHDAARATADVDFKAREDALEVKMHEFREEMRLQNIAKLQDQRDDFEQQRRALAESKHRLTEEVEVRGRTLKQVQSELAQVRQSHEQELRNLQETQLQKPESKDDNPEKERLLAEQLSSVQARADALQISLETATAEARAAREDAQKKDTMRSVIETKARGHTARITELEGHLQTARFEAECTQADVAAKQQLFRTNLDLNSRLRTLQSELDITRTDLAAKAQENLRIHDLESRIQDLQSQLEAAHADSTMSNQESVQPSELERRISSLQAQLETAHADLAAKDEQIRRFSTLEAHVRSLQSQLESARTNQVAKDQQTHQIADLERRVRSLQSQLESADADIGSQEQQISRHIEEQDRAEQRLNTSQGRLESLEVRNANLRHQLSEAQRDSAKTKADAERFEQDLEYANERMQDARDEADRRSAETKTLRSELSTLRKETNALKEAANHFTDLQDKVAALENELSSLREKAAMTQSTNLQATITDLRSQLSDLQDDNAALKLDIQGLTTALLDKEDEHEALNKAMDEKMATMLSKMMKEKARTVVGKRDGQWVESVGKVQSEKELLGKVLMKQWGREEVGIVDEGKGEKQAYKYKYVKKG